jgi:hypothetical protein
MQFCSGQIGDEGILKVKISKITKVAGAGLLGFVAVSLAADKYDLAPLASQVAGFAGAFVGSLVAKGRTRKKEAPTPRGLAASTPTIRDH